MSQIEFDLADPYKLNQKDLNEGIKWIGRCHLERTGMCGDWAVNCICWRGAEADVCIPGESLR